MKVVFRKVTSIETEQSLAYLSQVRRGDVPPAEASQRVALSPPKITEPFSLGDVYTKLPEDLQRRIADEVRLRQWYERSQQYERSGVFVDAYQRAEFLEMLPQLSHYDQDHRRLRDIVAGSSTPLQKALAIGSALHTMPKGDENAALDDLFRTAKTISEDCTAESSLGLALQAIAQKDVTHRHFDEILGLTKTLKNEQAKSHVLSALISHVPQDRLNSLKAEVNAIHSGLLKKKLESDLVVRMKYAVVA